MMPLHIILYLTFAGFALAEHGKLPNSMPRCRRKEANFDECLKEAIQKSIPALAPGLPKLGVVSMDPLKIDSLEMKQGTQNGPVFLDVKYKNWVMSGLASTRVTKVVSDLDNYKLEIFGHVTKPIDIESEYAVKGNVLVLPLIGTGKCHLSLDNVSAHVTLTGNGLNKNGRTYYDLKNLTAEIETSRLHMNFENLLSGDKNLGDNINLFLNENWELLWQETSSSVTKALEKAFKSIAVRLFSKVPMNDIFLP